MSAINLRDVSEEDHREIRIAAAKANKSIKEFMMGAALAAARAQDAGTAPRQE